MICGRIPLSSDTVLGKLNMGLNRRQEKIYNQPWAPPSFDTSSPTDTAAPGTAPTFNRIEEY